MKESNFWLGTLFIVFALNGFVSGILVEFMSIGFVLLAALFLLTFFVTAEFTKSIRDKK